MNAKFHTHFSLLKLFALIQLKLRYDLSYQIFVRFMTHLGHKYAVMWLAHTVVAVTVKTVHKYMEKVSKCKAKLATLRTKCNALV